MHTTQLHPFHTILNEKMKWSSLLCRKHKDKNMTNTIDGDEEKRQM